MRVGLLEDDDAIQEMLTLVLQDEGYMVVTYANAQHCLDALTGTFQESGSVDLMIVDLRLGGSVSGTEVIQQIRDHPRFLSLPIILTTAASYIDMNELQKLGVVLLEKPFSVDDLTTMIKEMTQSHLAN